MYDISIIVPVYKVENYIRRCVDSILAQTLQTFELILVDDGSPDNSGTICDEYAAQDSRIRVIHQHNQGQAAARNRALDIAQGEYIAFVDSDDYVHPQALEILLTNAQTHNAQISVCGYQPVQALVAHHALSSVPSERWQGHAFLRHCLINGIDKKPWVLWDKLFHRDCFRGIRFPEGRIYEDNAIVYRMLYEAETVADCDAKLYYYFYNENSTVNQTFRRKHLDWLLVPEEMIAYFAEKNDPVLIDKCNRMYLSELETMCRNVKAFLKDPKLERALKQKLRAQYLHEKKRYPITIHSHPGIFEVLFPAYSWCLWTYRGLKTKLLKR